MGKGVILTGQEAHFESSVIYVGSTPLGGNYPIRIQSMTNTDTLDTKASVNQCIRIIEAGADFVRLTAQGIKEAENLAHIKKEIRRAGYNTSLVADIHFNPAAAETAARIVEKVRINPGNYADKRASFEIHEFTDKEYDEELERVHDKLLPLINICREHKTVIRIGINHGSLSDRIMTRFGNTPEGMVNSALEFIRIFRSENFNDLVLSMKSSDSAVMISATRMLVKIMQSENLTYPLHLGVTEAGEGEDGRIRSAAGIGALLAEGIGDTIRVSLSEEPEKEIPVARKLADYYPRGIFQNEPGIQSSIKSVWSKPLIFKQINGPLVVSDLTSIKESPSPDYEKAGFEIDKTTGEVRKNDSSADLIIVKDCQAEIPENISVALPESKWHDLKNIEKLYPIFHESFNNAKFKSQKLNILQTGSDFEIQHFKDLDQETTLILFRFDPEKELYAGDYLLNKLEKNNLSLNIVLNPVFREDSLENLQIKASALLGRYVLDRRVAGISISNIGEIDLRDITTLAFSILQCTETRITRTMYLSCPTCGRTKFNLQESVKKVKAATGHLKGLKIAVMGCIVNGPGEMAGADYGYVGAATGKVHIYKGTEAVLKNIPEEDAVKELLKVIEADQGN
jgi:(E)-4-hydroxy-3-methylbut-2-enyl-diphosphate synthase